MRICDCCFSYQQHHTPFKASLDNLPFRAIATIASYLPVSSVFSISQANHSLHRTLFSKDFDLSFWKFTLLRAQSQPSSLNTILDDQERSVCGYFHNLDQVGKLSPSVQTNTNTSRTQLTSSEMQLSVRITNDDVEIPTFSSTEGCYWRLEYIKCIAVPGSLKCSLSFLNYSVVSYDWHWYDKWYSSFLLILYILWRMIWIILM